MDKSITIRTHKQELKEEAEIYLGISEIISRHSRGLKLQVGTSLSIGECENIMTSIFFEAIDFSNISKGLKHKTK